MLNSRMLKQFNQAYANDALKAAIYGASPIGIVVMLYEGVIKALSSASIAIDAGRFDEKARMINKAVDILEGLRIALDLEQGSEAAVNLNDLYIYMKMRLAKASLKNDKEILAEVKGLMETILPAWQQVDRANAAAQAEANSSSGA
ncbi:flagellar export chaperone FliS [Chromobacterium amazonense]|uniref:Flagellar secretion chaperone FliS n=1 Tax=Chromobacterium amazonense TaxID=1382803 RepID=A0A2S9X1K9_9NEIS|nr:flagellar export chaperone FliS [Chromobacterium amazonense]KIA81773.1 flagellar biosynthesis protein FliS [Chromobacterium piscinae]MBM2885168.1 flagellar export chaperone FliS [Chromobacterium amazonense]MDE1714484.1 flagellar export chaperone FliS [Chromobacterium amazonense]MDQ4538992.1 flagellar export chaperone FliS [Chromobacterium amazonense]PRP69573.1 flagellar export chaperone FliS [Chromobacterium amazonense]